MMKNFWSPDELETLHRMLAENKTRVEIAEALGCARARIDGRIRFERKTPEQRLEDEQRDQQSDRYIDHRLRELREFERRARGK